MSPEGAAIADLMVRTFGYAQAVRFVERLRWAGFDRNSRIPAARTLRRAELRRVPLSCDVTATAARLNLRPDAVRRALRRRRTGG